MAGTGIRWLMWLAAGCLPGGKGSPGTGAVSVSSATPALRQEESCSGRFLGIIQAAALLSKVLKCLLPTRRARSSSLLASSAHLLLLLEFSVLVSI